MKVCFFSLFFCLSSFLISVVSDPPVLTQFKHTLLPGVIFSPMECKYFEMSDGDV